LKNGIQFENKQGVCMKVILFSVIFSMSSLAWSERTEPDFDFFKHEAADRIDQRMAELATAKACIQAATDRKALKECHKAMKDEHREAKKERKMKKSKGDK
jgi:hypothetical protein